MFKLETLFMAFEALISNKFRTLLSMLGIIIGVSTVIGVVSIGAGAKAKIEEQFKNLSVTSIVVFPTRGSGSSRLSEEDLKTVLAESKFTNEGNARVSGSGSIAFGKEQTNATIMGVTENFFEISNLKIQTGETFTLLDNQNREKIIILGSTLAETLFETADNALGKTVKVNNRQFTVTGVLKENGSSTFGTSYDDTAYAPINTAQQNILGNNAQVQLVFLAREVDLMDLAQEEITAILRKAHRLRDNQEDDFRLRDPGSIVSSATETSDTLAFLLISVASMVLLVSGIGIMNVMFVTVAERTKEIGVLKAIGAKQKDILTQFLLESVMLSVTGGVLGIILGMSIIPLLKDYGAVQSLNGAILGFSFSVIVGIFFGFYPALKASKLDPVDALRSE
ncbi:FtsX-like permease family protein [bacterium]|nr:FtsX-like permease family protein [bacterium]NCQ54752.1 FtsX-like permease family protein [Candidatus Parcubacteria bacterium]NCS68005.1 FtsX-like permease family protein [Candidatus Peregrinibacteria bacterium]NCS95742.1 FtsX-like permease family protein [bacterium]